MNLCDWSVFGLSTGDCLSSRVDGVEADFVYLG